MSTIPPHKLPPPPKDSEAMYRAVMHPVSAVPGLLKFAMVCAVVGVFIWHAAKVAQAQACTANSGTWDGAVCRPPVIEVKQYHITLQPEDMPQAPSAPQSLPQGPVL